MWKLFGLKSEFKVSTGHKLFFWLPTLMVFTEKHECVDPFCVLNYNTILHIVCVVGNFTCSIAVYKDGWVK